MMRSLYPSVSTESINNIDSEINIKELILFILNLLHL